MLLIRAADGSGVNFLMFCIWSKIAEGVVIYWSGFVHK